MRTAKYNEIGLEDGTSSIRLGMDKAENRILRLRWISALHNERVKYLKRSGRGPLCSAQTVYGSTKAYVYLEDMSYAARRIFDTSFI